MKLKYFSSCILALILFLNISHAQKAVPAWVVQFSGDTIRGFASINFSEKNPDIIKFGSREDNLKKYEVEDFKAFGFIKENSQWEIYESYEVEIDESPQEIEFLSADSEPNFEKRRLWLQLLVKGKLSLYKFTDKRARTHFFAGKENQTPQELVQKKYIVYLEYTKVLRYNERFRRQLSELMSACQKLSFSRFANLEYSYKELFPLFSEYNICSGDGNKYTYRRNSPKLRLYLTGGIHYHTLNVSSNEVESDFTLSDYDWHTGFAIGGGMELVLPQLRNRLLFRLEFLIQSFKYTGSYEVQVNPFSNSRRRGNINLSGGQLKFNIIPKYYLSTGKTSIYLGVGISNGFTVWQDNIAIREEVTGTNVVPRDLEADDVTDSYVLGGIILLGAEVNRFSFEVRNSISLGILNEKGVSQGFNWFAMFGYSLIK